PDSTAPRPYDETPIPAVDLLDDLEPGLSYRVFEVSTPWTPDVNTLKPNTESASGTVPEFDISVRTRKKNIVIAYEGFIEVPKTGSYAFRLQADRGAVLRLHEATIIDADRGYDSDTMISADVRLEKGYHPVQLTYDKGNRNVDLGLQLEWSG